MAALQDDDPVLDLGMLEESPAWKLSSRFLVSLFNPLKMSPSCLINWGQKSCLVKIRRHFWVKSINGSNDLTYSECLV